MPGSISKKMGLKPGTRAFLVNVPKDARALLDLPPLEIAARLSGKFDYIHLSAESQAEFEHQFPRLKTHLKSTGMLWV
jgi:hypothetical protein